MQFYTSRYASHGKHPKAVGISYEPLADKDIVGALYLKKSVIGQDSPAPAKVVVKVELA